MTGNWKRSLLGTDDTGWLDEVLAGMRRQPTGLGGVFSEAQPPLAQSIAALLGHTDGVRRRAEWNDRFCHWERPASVSEAGTIERADALVSAIVAANHWLTAQGVRVARQGSYHNNTNVRTEADIDLRVVHPAIKVEYHANVIDPAGWGAIAYGNAPLTLDQIFVGLRTNLARDFRQRFGQNNVEVGNKAIRIKEATGSRAEIDVVPAVPFHYVSWSEALTTFQTLKGVAIWGCDGRWIANFPEQHVANGRAKRERTAHRFKKVVRVFKRMRADMTAHSLLTIKVPSFLVECLVYIVEDVYFLIETDDRYGRVSRIAQRMQALLLDRTVAVKLLEINGVKWLFHEDQAWSYDDALMFVNAVVAHLGDA